MSAVFLYGYEYSARNSKHAYAERKNDQGLQRHLRYQPGDLLPVSLLSGAGLFCGRNHLPPDIFRADSKGADTDSRICVGQLYGGGRVCLYRWTGQIETINCKTTIHGLK